MGSAATEGRELNSKQPELFPVDLLGGKAPKSVFVFEGGRIPERGVGPPPSQTNSKSKLIAEYLSNFQRVTNGGMYIDGFAAPQSRGHEEAWTARRVLEIEPKRIRNFWLCDIDPAGIKQLRTLKAEHHRDPRSRRVFVHEGDFNEIVHDILKSDRFTPRAAIFALLDQRNTECHWSTVKALANRGGRTKIELMYFLGASWLHRSLTQSKTPDRIAEIERWWGGPDWTALKNLTQIGMVDQVAARFSFELGYKYVNAFPIFQRDTGKKRSFYLIHASDHPEAPKLMTRAYLKTVGSVEGTIADGQAKLPW